MSVEIEDTMRVQRPMSLSRGATGSERPRSRERLSSSGAGRLDASSLRECSDSTALCGGGAGVGRVWNLGEVLDERYRLLELLGEGGFGAVFRAEDLQLGETVAIKVLAQSRLERSARRFRNAAELLCYLRHPAVVAGLRCGRSQGSDYLVMEDLPESYDLRALLEIRGLLPWEEALQLTSELVSALQYLHGRGVIHRDVKLKNALLTERGVVLIDFDLAKAICPEGWRCEDSGSIDLRSPALRLVLEASESTQLGLTGTPLYMCPERLEGGVATPASDLYAAGLVLYKLLTGQLPHQGRIPQDLRELLAARRQAPPSLREDHGLDVPAALDALLARALSPLRAERYDLATELIDDLGALLMGGSPPASELESLSA